MNFSRSLRGWPARKLSRFSAFRAQPWSHIGKYFFLGAFRIVNFGCALHLFTTYVGTFTLTEGVSMLPTLAVENELVLENRLTCHLFPDKFSRGDLVIVKSPLDPSRRICKRIIGLPGDVICVDPLMSSNEHVIIPQGHVWISGDNMANSRDSRIYGPVSMALIESRVVMSMILWPLSKFTFKLIRNQTKIVE
ncbi:peptidase S24/S26A/S26B/S26C [Cyathus striatus]|nr:peptidase S24/S26A/S26B/S26C [Cyathus striatus]